MSYLDVVETISGTRFGVPSAHVQMVQETGPGGSVLRLINTTTAETVRLAVTDDAAASVAGFSVHGAGRVAMSVTGQAGSVLSEMLTAARDAGAGEGYSVSAFLANTPVQGQAVELITVPVGDAVFLYAARAVGSGLSAFRLSDANGLTTIGTVADTATVNAAQIATMASANIGGTAFLFTGSSNEDGITVWSVGANGALTAVQSLGAAQMVPVDTITALRTVQMGGDHFLIAAASGSSSLTVFRMAADGTMVPTDHVIDELGTRFQGVTAMEVVTVGNRTYVLAAGADHGISLLTLTPDGRLVHLETLADSTTTALSGVSEIRAVVVGGTVQVFVTSGAEGGLSQLRIDLADAGMVSDAATTGSGGNDLLTVRTATGSSVTGAAGDDLLIDGAGSDTLTGGTGADVFVLTADGIRDVVADFDPARDRIDLTHWAFYRNTGQLTVTATATGAILRFGTEELELRTATGTPLTPAQVRAMNFGDLSRVAFETGTPAPSPPPAGLGTAGADTLIGGASADTLTGLAGDDLLIGGGGADLVNGGAGFDILGFSTLSAPIRLDLSNWAASSAAVAMVRATEIEGYIGTAFADVMFAGNRGVWFDGGAGNDTLTGGKQASQLFGAGGDDSLTGGRSEDRLSGGDGNDTLIAGADNDTLIGGTGNDHLWGDDGQDDLLGEAGQDSLTGGIGDDRLYGGAGWDTLVGDVGNDTLDGGLDGDRLDGGAGNDWLNGGIGNDWMFGASGADSLYGDAGNDQLGGGSEADTLYGGAGRDTLWGEDGNDRLVGDVDSDRLDGGSATTRYMVAWVSTRCWAGPGAIF